MSETAHPAFVEAVRCALVLPRRNVRRAIALLEQAGMPAGSSDMTALDYAHEAIEQITARDVAITSLSVSKRWAAEPRIWVSLNAQETP